MIIFKLLYKKMLFSFSTFFLTFIMYTLFIVILRHNSIRLVDSIFQGDFYNISYSATRALFINFGLILLPVFIATKIPHFISKEIKSGELLAMMGKPVSRTRIIIEKFLAFEAVVLSWTLTCFGMFYFAKLSYFPYPFLFSFIQSSIWTIFKIIFIYQLILSIILIFISLKLQPGAILGIGVAIAIFNLISSQIITNIASNQSFQSRKSSQFGSTMKEDKYLKLTQGQKRYKSFFRHIDIREHISYIFTTSMKDIFIKYNIKNFEDLYNQEVITKTITNQIRDKVGNIKNEKIYVVAGFKDWLNVKRLYISYALISIFIVIFGFVYFRRKDIV